MTSIREFISPLSRLHFGSEIFDASYSSPLPGALLSVHNFSMNDRMEPLSQTRSLAREILKARDCLDALSKLNWKIGPFYRIAIKPCYPSYHSPESS